MPSSDGTVATTRTAPDEWIVVREISSIASRVPASRMSARSATGPSGRDGRANPGRENDIAAVMRTAAKRTFTDAPAFRSEFHLGRLGGGLFHLEIRLGG